MGGPSGDVDPEQSGHELRQVPRVRGCDNHAITIQGHCLSGQDYIAVKCGIGCRWPASLASFGPELRRLAHRRGCDSQVLDAGDEGIEPRNARDPAGSDQLSPNLVIGNFRDCYRRTANRRLKKQRPVPTLEGS